MSVAAHPLPLPVQDLLDIAASLSSSAFPVLSPQPWHWLVRAGTLELHTSRADGRDSRLSAIGCGVALQRALTVFAALGVQGAICAGDDGDLIATVTPAGRHTATANELAMHQALKQGSAAPPTPSHRGDDPQLSGPMLVSHAVWPYGVRVYVLDDNTARFLNAMTHTASQEKVGDQPPLRLALVTGEDTASDWVRAGQALSAAMLTARAAGLIATIDDLAETPGTRALLRNLVTPC